MGFDLTQKCGIAFERVLVLPAYVRVSSTQQPKDYMGPCPDYSMQRRKKLTTQIKPKEPAETIRHCVGACSHPNPKCTFTNYIPAMRYKLELCMLAWCMLASLYTLLHRLPGCLC